MDTEILAELRSLNAKLDKMVESQTLLTARMAATETTLDEWRLNIGTFWAREWPRLERLDASVDDLRVNFAELRERQPKIMAGAAVGGSAGFVALFVEGVRLWLGVGGSP